MLVRNVVEELLGLNTTLTPTTLKVGTLKGVE